jgi:hypothetical protein
MEDRIKGIINAKIKESVSDTHRINEIVKIINNSIKDLSINDALMLGIIIGRVYNSFYYQHRRILGRDPNDKEFYDFLELLKDNLTELVNTIKAKLKEV